MRRAACLALVLSALAAAAPALARSPPGGDDGPIAAGRDEGEAARGQALFDAGRWLDAALVDGRVAAGETADDEVRRQIAQYHLGIALYRLDFRVAAFAIFSAIADDSSHPRFEATGPWLAKLAAELPEPAGVAERLTRYHPAGIARLGPPELRAELEYQLGRYRYKMRSYPAALEHLAKVGEASPRRPAATFLTALSHLQLRRAVPAVRALSDMLRATERDPALRDLALLTMARALYSTSFSVAIGGTQPTLDGSRLEAAIHYWERVDAGGPSFSDALLELSWARFMAGDYSRALGSLHALGSPYFEGSRFPEADNLRGLIALSLCRYDDATSHAARMIRRYHPLHEQLAAALFQAERRGERGLLDLAAGTRPGSSSRALGELVERSLSDREVREHLSWLRQVEAELGRLSAAPATLRRSTLGDRLQDSLELSRELATRAAAGLVRARIERALAELGGQLDDARKLLVDAARAKAARAKASITSSGELPTTGVVTDFEHVLWPFDGEYWRDELTSYRQMVRSRCDR